MTMKKPAVKYYKKIYYNKIFYIVGDILKSTYLSNEYQEVNREKFFIQYGSGIPQREQINYETKIIEPDKITTTYTYTQNDYEEVDPASIFESNLGPIDGEGTQKIIMLNLIKTSIDIK